MVQLYTKHESSLPIKVLYATYGLLSVNAKKNTSFTRNNCCSSRHGLHCLENRIYHNSFIISSQGLISQTKQGSSLDYMCIFFSLTLISAIICLA